jgi:hypothetical protein
MVANFLKRLMLNNLRPKIDTNMNCSGQRLIILKLYLKGIKKWPVRRKIE